MSNTQRLIDTLRSERSSYIYEAAREVDMGNRDCYLDAVVKITAHIEALKTTLLEIN